MSVTFGARRALVSVSMPAEPARVSVVVGGDGAGKTTALRTLVGLVRPAGGVVRMPPRPEIGYVPATGGLYPDLTAFENLAFAAAAYAMSGATLQRHCANMLERVGLAEVAQRPAGALSGGMQRKLAVGMGLVHSPQLLVLDEPTTGVDPVSRTELWRLVSGAVAAGSAVVVTTTYVNEAERGAYAVLLEDGRELASGPPAEILRRVSGTISSRRGERKPSDLAWRRGTEWHVWTPAGERDPADLPPGAIAVRPDMEDAAIVAALQVEGAMQWRLQGQSAP